MDSGSSLTPKKPHSDSSELDILSIISETEASETGIDEQINQLQENDRTVGQKITERDQNIAAPCQDFKQGIRNSNILYAAYQQLLSRLSHIKSLKQEPQSKMKSASHEYLQAKQMIVEAISRKRLERLQLNNKMTDVEQQTQSYSRAVLHLESQKSSLEQQFQALYYNLNQLGALHNDAYQKYVKTKQRQLEGYNLLLIIREQTLTLKHIARRQYCYNPPQLKHRLFNKRPRQMNIYMEVLVDIVYYLITELNLKSFELLKFTAYDSPAFAKVYSKELIQMIMGIEFKNYGLQQEEVQGAENTAKVISIHISESLVCIVHEAFRIILQHLQRKVKLQKLTSSSLLLSVLPSSLILIKINPQVPAQRQLTIEIQ